MGISGFFRKKGTAVNRRLVGCWRLVRIDGVDAPDFVELDFRPDGQLFSSTKTRTRATWEISCLTYYLDGSDTIVIDSVRTGFTFEPDGTLRLDSVSNSAWYEKGPKIAPEP